MSNKTKSKCRVEVENLLIFGHKMVIFLPKSCLSHFLKTTKCQTFKIRRVVTNIFMSKHLRCYLRLKGEYWWSFNKLTFDLLMY